MRVIFFPICTVPFKELIIKAITKTRLCEKSVFRVIPVFSPLCGTIAVFRNNRVFCIKSVFGMKIIVFSFFCSFRQNIIIISVTEDSLRYNSEIFSQNVSDYAINIEDMPSRTFRALNRIFLKCCRIFSNFSPQKSNGLIYDSFCLS